MRPSERPLPYLIAMKVKGTAIVSYYGGGGTKHGFRWVQNPRDGMFLSKSFAQLMLDQCRKSHPHGITFERVEVKDAIRLYVLQGRRGDIRNLPSPEVAGDPTLTARPQG